MSSNNFSTPNGAPDPTNKNLWQMLLGLKSQAGKILWVPLITSMGTFALNLMTAIADDGLIDEQEFHELIQGTSSLQIVVIALVMALLKAKNTKP